MRDGFLPSIVLFEPSPDLRDALRLHLECASYAVHEGKADLLQSVTDQHPDLVLFGPGNPLGEAIDLCRLLRRSPGTRDLPQMVLAAAGDDERVLRAFEAGSDDVLSEPFTTTVLLLHLRALLRRSHAQRPQEVVRYESISIDMTTRRVSRAGREVHVRPTEFRLLHFLLSHPAKVFTRAELLHHVWGDGVHVEPRTIDVHVRRLRQALNDGGQADIIRTVRSAGYAIDADTVTAGGGI